MTPGIERFKPTAGALRAASRIQADPMLHESTAELIDCEPGLREVLEILEEILAEAGDLIESRSPELVAEAQDIPRRHGDATPRQAE